MTRRVPLAPPLSTLFALLFGCGAPPTLDDGQAALQAELDAVAPGLELTAADFDRFQATRPDVSEQPVRDADIVSGFGSVAFPNSEVSPEFRLIPREFTLAMVRSFERSLSGYFWVLQRGDSIEARRAKNWARFAADGDELPWTSRTRMHVASTSKLITAAAVLKLLAARGLDPTTTPIVDFLPTYWNPDSSVTSITFHQLLKHEAGFCSTGWVYLSARRQVEAGVGPSPCSLGTQRYRNVNYVILRVLVATLSGFDRTAWDGASLGMDVDGLWDWASTDAYMKYVWTEVFEPAGVGNVPVTDFPETALAYRAPPNTLTPLPGRAAPGWDFGNEGAGAGAIGWQMTPEEVVRVMRALRAGAILTDPDVLFADNYGMVNGSTDCSPFGQRNHFWGGSWSEPGAASSDQRRRELNVIAFLPNDRLFVMFANSPFGPADARLDDQICENYVRSHG